MADSRDNLERAAGWLGFLTVELPDATSSANAAIRYLVGQLVATGLLAAEDAESAAEAVLKREALGTTRTREAAFPRGVMSTVERVIGIVGRSKVGVPWDSSNGSSVLRVCLTLAPLHRPGDYWRVLERLTLAARELPSETTQHDLSDTMPSGR